MKTEWTAKRLASACNGVLLRDSSIAVAGFSIDSRTIKPGNVFVAFKGENQDGHKYAAAAARAGASVLLISDELELTTLDSAAVIKVDDTLVALQAIAGEYRSMLSSVFVAVTGSNGKTTTRSMVYHLLSEAHRCSATSGNFNNHIGLPLTVLRIDEDSEYSILEMGMNHQGEIRTLCKIAYPDAAVISNIGPAHIGILGSLENIARAKAEILELLQPEQIAVVPGDTGFTDLFRASTRARLFTFGENPGNDYRLENLQMYTDSVAFEFVTPVGIKKCLLNLAGRHNAFNAAAALAACHLLGVDLDVAIQRIASFAPVGARMEKVVIDGINILLDCYNANPASMEEALRYLAICPPQRIAVLGDMRELGEMSEELHRNLGCQAAAANPELLLCVGDDAAHIASAAREKGMPESSVISLNSNDKAAELLKERLRKGSTVLFKASRGMHFEKIVQQLWPDLGKDLH